MQFIFCTLQRLANDPKIAGAIIWKEDADSRALETAGSHVIRDYLKTGLFDWYIERLVIHENTPNAIRTKALKALAKKQGKPKTEVVLSLLREPDVGEKAEAFLREIKK
jgi:hypothetical protein